MKVTERTGCGALLQTAQFVKLMHNIGANSTLNQKFGIQNGIAPASSDKNGAAYVAIGNGGHKLEIGEGNIPIMRSLPHRPRDAALYNHLPFVLRLPEDDLTPSERANYRLRRTETHNSTLYVAYYLKTLDLSETVPALELRTVENGVTTSVPFVHTLADLSPTPPDLAPGGTLVTTGDYLAATAKVPFVFTADDVTELLNVANIIYGDPAYAIISELALCSGADKAVTGVFNGITSGYTEAVGVQVVNFISASFPAAFNNNGTSFLFDLGSVEPMLDVSSS